MLAEIIADPSSHLSLGVDEISVQIIGMEKGEFIAELSQFSVELVVHE